MATDSPTTDPLSDRIEHFRRVLCRGKIGHRPSLRQRDAALRAARLCALAEQAATQAATNPELWVHAVRLDNAAHRASEALDKLLDGYRQVVAPPTLADMLNTSDLVRGHAAK